MIQEKQPPELHRSPGPHHRKQIQVLHDAALQRGPIQAQGVFERQARPLDGRRRSGHAPTGGGALRARGVLICGKPLPPQGSRTSRVPAGTTRWKSAALRVTMESARASIAAAAIRAS